MKSKTVVSFLLIVGLIGLVGLFIISSQFRRGVTQHTPVNNKIKNIVKHYREPRLPKCQGNPFTVSPIEFSKLQNITPLGNLNPPEHTLPTQHMYLGLTQTNVPLYAPGNLTITQIQTTKYLARGTEDYGLNFGICDQVRGYFLHLKKLAPKLAELTAGSRCERHAGQSEYEYCDARVNVAVKAGDLLGYVSDKHQQNFDLGAYDRGQELFFVNQERHMDREPHIICPLNLFSDEVRPRLYQKIERTDVGRCGRTDYDMPGTLQGNWYHKDVPLNSPGAWGQELALVPDNFSSDKYVISIGGIFTKPSRLIFTPESSGTTNRAFNKVRQDGKIYCYQSNDRYYNFAGKLLVQLTSATELKIEQQADNCEASSKFNNPAIYRR